ncbi:predicted protein [Enterococcus faecalis T8]|nr:predicted protein [Enterococcus faecalis T8]
MLDSRNSFYLFLSCFFLLSAIISQEKQLEQIQQISETEKMARPRF